MEIHSIWILFIQIHSNYISIPAHSFSKVVEFEISKGYPFLVNDPETTKRARLSAEDYLGAENVVDLDLWMGAEDFAFYSHEIPACFYRLGTGNEEKGTANGVHTPNFNIDEDALEISIGLMSWIAINELKN